MRAMVIDKISSLVQEPDPLRLVELPMPEPGPKELLVEVSTCGVCHTELDEIEGRTPPAKPSGGARAPGSGQGEGLRQQSEAFQAWR